MKTAIPEPKAGEEVVLRREARKALSGRVPVVLSIAVAMLVGMLSGYGLRALTAEGGVIVSRQTCPVLVVPPSVISPGKDCVAGRPRMYLLGQEQPPAAAAEPAEQCDGTAKSASAAKERALKRRADRALLAKPPADKAKPAALD
jgi:hypothetical protein